MSPFPCSPPDPAPISPSALPRTAGVRVPMPVWDGSRAEEELKTVRMGGGDKGCAEHSQPLLAFPNQPDTKMLNVEGDES